MFQKYIDRELSWIEFNKRVLFESINPANPILERMRFLSISVSNLEEFFIIRYCKWRNSGPSQKAITTLSQYIHALIEEQGLSWKKLCYELIQYNVHICDEDSLTSADTPYLCEAISSCNQSTGRGKFTKFITITREHDVFSIDLMDLNGLVTIGHELRLIPKWLIYEYLGKSKNDNRVTEIGYVIRDADTFEISTIFVRKSSDEAVVDYISQYFGINKNVIVRVRTFIPDLIKAINIGISGLKLPPIQPKIINDIFAVLDKKHDILLQHPYHSFKSIEKFFEHAALDKNVIGIKHLIYRIGENSSIISSLIKALKLKKKVTVVVEIRARFNEEENIRYAQILKSFGAKIYFGMPNYKVHCKLSLIAYKGDTDVKYYAHYGTGNYNRITAETYQDLSLFTADQNLCDDANHLIDCVIGHSNDWSFKKLIVSPYFMRQNLLNFIDKEIKLFHVTKVGSIWIKCNALIDQDIIDSLYRASKIGITNNIIVRGMCCLIPQVPGLSENITVKSIIGKFLEHSRIYCFGLGKTLPHPDAEVYISSADVMERNLDDRIETMIPITNIQTKLYIMEHIMTANFRDTKNSWILADDGTYKKCPSDGFSVYKALLKEPETT